MSARIREAKIYSWQLALNASLEPTDYFLPILLLHSLPAGVHASREFILKGQCPPELTVLPKTLVSDEGATAVPLAEEGQPEQEGRTMSE